MKRVHHEQMARIGQATASRVRLRALNLLAQRPWKVGELAAELGESVASASAHLKVLRSAGMVVEEKRGREHWCRVEAVEVFQLLASLQRAAEALLPELREAALGERDDPFLLRGASLAGLAEDVAGDRVALLDLRPGDEFAAGHIPGARSYPAAGLGEADLSPLRSRDRLVAYCRGPWCLMARRGVEVLNERGLPARRLRAGVVDWIAEGLPLIRGGPAAASDEEHGKEDARPRDSGPTIKESKT